jgi:SAM-dependent methyltransferase
MALQDLVYYTAGIGFLVLAKIKHTLRGYSTPKPFDISETDQCVAYDVKVVEHWLSQLRQYTRSDSFLSGKNVLELGPGADLGIGSILLLKGAAAYNACDVNDLATRTPDEFYHALFKALSDTHSRAEIDAVKEQLVRLKGGQRSQLNYVVRDDFDLAAAFGRNTIELVFSQAAFEHFDDVNATVGQLSAVCKPGAVIVAEIDLQTHSRWIRQKDPNNIYRYPQGLYNAFWFRGIPNRIRPYQYREMFERHGWRDMVIVPLSRADKHGAVAVHERFRSEINQMDCLSIMLCATKKAAADRARQ